jgi:magnesium-transporting ATPase (P-type)
MTDEQLENRTRAWHALSAEQVLQQLESSTEGLAGDEVRRRTEEHGPNRLPAPHKRGPLLRFFHQFRNLFIYVLLAAAVITALLGHWVDFIVILGVVLIIALIGFIQEGKAEKALESIRNMLSLNAGVIRAGRRQTVPAEELVPGDVVFVQSGDKVPADLRLFKVKELRVDEAILTGESESVTKTTEPVPEKADVADRTCLAFSGTSVNHGQGMGVVVATGQRTEIGRISEMLAQVETLTTPLLRELDRLARYVTVVIIAVAGGMFGFGVLVREYTSSEMFMAAVGLMVAAIPEGLPAIVTITLALGVQRMAGRHAIIRRLPAVETLGSVTVICSDKTGTLTRNEMTVQAVVTSQYLYEISGVGYDPHGSVSVAGEEITREIIFDARPELQELTRAAILCNDSQLEQKENQWLIQGDPTEGALLTLGGKIGFDRGFEEQERPRTDVIPFESEHRFMATLHHDHKGHGYVYVKGAPERILEMCNRQAREGREEPLNSEYWQGAAADLAGRGQRLLAAAFKPTAPEHRDLNFKDVEDNLILLGLFGIADPPRQEAIEAVQACKSAGIKVKMITGDHSRTAQAIAQQMGISAEEGARVLTGAELETISDEELRREVVQVSVFARSSPEHKQRLVIALQENQEVVAMTGDGVNDAPALKRANIGVAMGVKGTEVAKEASEMVLADDNFASIAHAVEEGRTVYGNIKKSIIFILPTNGAQSLVLLAAVFLGIMLPITPLQILWVNMITAVTLALALAFEPPEANVMQRPPRDPGESIVTPFLLWRIGYVSVVIVIGVIGLFTWQLEIGASEAAARTVAVNTLVMFQIFYLFNTRYLYRSVLSWEGLVGNRYVLLAVGLALLLQLAFTYAPPMQLLFETAAIEARIWLHILPAAVTIYFIVEVEKWLVAAWRKKRGLG